MAEAVRHWWVLKRVLVVELNLSQIWNLLLVTGTEGQGRGAQGGAGPAKPSRSSRLSEQHRNCCEQTVFKHITIENMKELE